MPRRYYGLLTLTLLAGACLRLWHLLDVPPGLHYDMAADALIARSIAFDGYRPIFSPAYAGREVLYLYWLAAAFRVLGSSVFVLRLATALAGLLIIPVTFFAVREMLRFEPASEAAAALAAVFTAVAFYQVAYSRFPFRNFIPPLVEAPALGFLFRGLRRRRWPDLILAGVFTGLVAYSYIPARFFIFPVAVFWIALLIGHWRRPAPAQPRAWLGQPSPLAGLALFGLAAAVTFAPLGLYFIGHPDHFTTRSSQVLVQPGETALLLQGIRRAAEMVFISGEPYERYNLPYLPLLSPALGVFFVIGLLLSVWNLFRPRARPAASAALATATEILLLVWMPIMLIPTAISVHTIFPSVGRATPVAPILFLYPARGLLAAYRWIQRRWRGPLIPYRHPLAVVIVVALAAGVFGVVPAYFDTWAHLPSQRLSNEADLVEASEYLNRQDLADTAVFFSSIHYRHPTVAYLARDYDRIRWLTGGTSLVVPAGGAMLYVFPWQAPPPEDWIDGWDAHLVAAPREPPGAPDTTTFRAYRFEAGEAPPLPRFNQTSLNFGNISWLTGWRLVTGTTGVDVDLRWAVENLPEAGDFLPFARLYDRWGHVWSESSSYGYPSEQWQPGDVLLTRLRLPLPPGLPPGSYHVEVYVYSPSTQVNLPHLGPTGQFAGYQAPVARLDLPGGPLATVDDYRAAHPMTPLDPATASSDPARPLRLLGYRLEPDNPRQGEPVRVTLYWHAQQALPGAGQVLIRLGDETLYAGQPVHGTFPFAEWAPGQMLADVYDVRVPYDFPSGPAPLSVAVEGVIDAPLAIALATPTIGAVERSFEAPPVQAEVNVDFAGLVALRGYTLSGGPPAALALVWQARAPVERDYLVFVHVLDASGQIVAQTDAMPRGGAYPTSLWAPGEYVRDDYSFDLPPGTYRVEAGLYRLDTGERLPLREPLPEGASANAVTLPPFDVP